MNDLAQDVAEGVLGAAKDGSIKVFIVKVFVLSIAICQRRNPRRALALRWHVKDEHVRETGT